MTSATRIVIKSSMEIKANIIRNIILNNLSRILNCPKRVDEESMDKIIILFLNLFSTSEE